MKTIEDIVTNKGLACEYGYNLEVVPYADVVKYMKLYAEQAIDAVCEHLKDYEHEEVDYSRKTPKTEDMLAIGYYGDGRDGDVMVWIDKQSILKIKEELK